MQARSASMGVLGALVTVAAVGIANVQPVGATRAATSPVVAPGIEAVAPLGTGGAPESMSRDGRYIAYQTTDSSLVHGSATSAVFVYDRVTRRNTLVTAMPDGSEATGTNGHPSISADGRYVAFEADADLINSGGTYWWPVWWRDMRTGTTRLVSTGDPHVDDPLTANHYGYSPVISGNGRYVAFTSYTVGPPQAFRGEYVRDMLTGKTRLVATSGIATQWGAAFSDDGRFILLSTWNSAAIVLDLVNRNILLLRAAARGDVAPFAALSSDGRRATYTFGPPSALHVVQYDRVTHASRALAIHNLGAASSNGRYVADGSAVYDTVTRSLVRVPNLCTGGGTVTAVNGGRVAFVAPNMHGNGTSWLYSAPLPGAAARPYRLVASDGGVFTYGGARFYGSTGNIALREPIVAMANARDGHGYWLVASDGGVFAFGSAKFYGSLGSLRLRSPIVGMAAAPDGRGYWLVASDGGVFAFGSTRFFGSLGGLHVTSPVSAMAASLDGRGYWLVARDGGVFAFGSARFHGSAFGSGSPAIGITASVDHVGYWIATADGNVYAFGTTALGSLAALHVRPAHPVVGIATVAGACGYRLVAVDGGVFNFGGAGLEGSAASLPLHAPIVAIG